METINERIYRITPLHLNMLDKLQDKRCEALYASLCEEFGEIAMALKIHHKIVRHKTLPEPITGEAVDLYICAVALQSEIATEYMRWDDDKIKYTMPDVRPVNLYLLPEEHKDDDPAFLDLTVLAEAGWYVGRIGQALWKYKKKESIKAEMGILCLELARVSYTMFTLHRKDEVFDDIVNAKLDKWEKNIATLPPRN